MTTLAAWAGVDRPAEISSLYLVSDSRFSDARSGNPLTNEGQKIYACRNEPHLFGYCGWVTFPAEVLEKMVEQIDKGVFFAAGDQIEERQQTLLHFSKTNSMQAHLRIGDRFQNFARSAQY